MSAHWHIASLVVRCRPAEGADLARKLATLPATEVPIVQDGRLIVLLEGESHGALAQRLDHIRLLEGVLAANLVYHHIDTEAENDDVHDTP